MHELLSVSTTSDDVIVLVGEIDAFSVGPLDEALRRAVTRGNGDVVVDLGAVTFMDSGGLNTFIRHFKPLDAAGRRLVLRTPQRAVHRALSVSGMTTVFDVVTS